MTGLQINLDPDPTDGGGGSFIDTLPEELRAEPSLASVPDVATLAKNYVNTKRMLGEKRLIAPKENWGEKEYGDFYNQIGRPESPDKYSDAEMNLPEGVKLDESRVTQAREAFHKLGLTDDQQKGVMQLYGGVIGETFSKASSDSEEAKKISELELKSEWGADYDANVDTAKGMIRQFGNEEFSQLLEESGIGNNPHFVRMLHKAGLNLLEDKAHGKGTGIPVGGPAAALAEIEALKQDKDFMEAFTGQHHPGHKAAVERNSALFKIAYSETQE